MSQELLDQCEDIANDYADRRTREAVERAERLRLGTWLPDWQTVMVCLKLVNEWLDYLAGREYAERYHYKVRDVGNTWQVYQDVDRTNPEEEG